MEEKLENIFCTKSLWPHCIVRAGALSIQTSKALLTDGMSRFDNDRNEIQLKPKTFAFLLSYCCNDSK